MRRRRPRILSAEERHLWAQVARSIKPIKGRTLDPAPDPEAAAPAGPPPSPDTKAAPVRPAAPAAPVPPGLPPLAALDRRTVTALRRGRQGLEARVDLHGLRQAEAHDVLRGFLRRAQADGLKVVLVITGKGGAAAEDSFGERGVLRRMVPHWLRLPDLRPLVVGFEEAAPHHGGMGALYVRLRRPTRGG